MSICPCFLRCPQFNYKTLLARMVRYICTRNVIRKLPVTDGVQELPELRADPRARLVDQVHQAAVHLHRVVHRPHLRVVDHVQLRHVVHRLHQHEVQRRHSEIHK